MTIFVRTARFKLIVRILSLLAFAIVPTGCGQPPREFTVSDMGYYSDDHIESSPVVAETLVRRSDLARAELGMVIDRFERLTVSQRGAILAAMKKAAAKDAVGGLGELPAEFQSFAESNPEVKATMDRYGKAQTKAELTAFRKTLSIARRSLRSCDRPISSRTIAQQAAIYDAFVERALGSTRTSNKLIMTEGTKTAGTMPLARLIGPSGRSTTVVRNTGGVISSVILIYSVLNDFGLFDASTHGEEDPIVEISRQMQAELRRMEAEGL